jgi:hypothetical protein
MSEMQTINRAYRVAWNLAVKHSAMKSGVGLKLNDAVKKLAKPGIPAEEIGRQAFEKVCPNLLSLEAV